jgi:exopolysaccharide biosynthesis operon protein EpsL
MFKPVPWLNLLLLPAIWLGGTQAVFAQAEQGLKFHASASVLQDNNLFRLSDSANVKASTGKDSAAETVGITTLGVSYSKDYSLQHIELDVSLADYRYQNFNYLSYTARNYSAAWRWSFTPRLRGSISSNRNETLNSFADYRGGSAFSQRNLRTDSNTGFDAVYEASAAWRMLGGVAQNKQVNEQAVVADSDYSASSAYLGASYELASGSSLTYRATASRGSYLNRSLSATALIDDAYDQTESDLRLHWVFSGKLSANVNAGFVQRTHPHFAQRNYSGPQMGANLNWAISGKTSLAAELSRRLGAYQTNYANISQTDKLAVGPNWQLSPKIALGLRYELSNIDYLDAPTSASSLSRQDSLRDTTLNLAWQPSQSATVNASLTSSTRSSTLAGSDYRSRLATVSANYNF